jgi:uncharacterized membrane protein YfcA
VARAIAIWIFGLLASAIIGGFAGAHLSETYDAALFWGAFAGISAFTCLRLWLAAPSKNSK